MSIFPFIDGRVVTSISNNNELPLLREYKWDFTQNQFELEDGKFKIVEGLEAVKIWIYKALKTQKARFPIYSKDYGHDLEKMIGKEQSEGYVLSQGRRYLKEALLISPYITNLREVKVNFNKDSLEFKFTAETVYGEVRIEDV